MCWRGTLTLDVFCREFYRETVLFFPSAHIFNRTVSSGCQLT
ncbi:hypothetical protein CV83915_3p0030 (plasmid) [Escherichia coli]|uniref:Uncharacterized protein n=1 Tax=Escherichia coli TaxID=562 RepID=A0A2H4TLB4_ECOLX|nr:hypothetical protein CV83915_3p0030 [Escherichia coli]